MNLKERIAEINAKSSYQMSRREAIKVITLQQEIIEMQQETLKSLMGPLPDISKYDEDNLRDYFQYEIRRVNKKCYEILEKTKEKMEK